MAGIMNRDLTQPETVEWAKVLLLEERYEEYLEFLEEAVELFPDDPEVRIHYATALIASRPDEVALQAGKAIQLEPNNPWRLVRAASLLYDVEEFDAARSYVVHAAQHIPVGFEFAPELSNLGGNLAAQTGGDEFAEEALSAALEEEPDRRRFARDLAQFLADRERTTEALKILDEALRRNPQDSKLIQLRDELGMVD
jgi:tetratricopeptide (TPR) repeat protein